MEHHLHLVGGDCSHTGNASASLIWLVALVSPLALLDDYEGAMRRRQQQLDQHRLARRIYKSPGRPNGRQPVIKSRLIAPGRRRPMDRRRVRR